MGFVASIKKIRRYLSDDETDHIDMSDLVSKLMDEKYQLEHVTLMNGSKEIEMETDRDNVIVHFKCYSRRGNSREMFEKTINMLKGR